MKKNYKINNLLLTMFMALARNRKKFMRTVLMESSSLFLKVIMGQFLLMDKLELEKHTQWRVEKMHLIRE